ncbi:MAG: energy transducer TonB [Thiothrix sp.]|nr:energy transducer TonB [Thiothrix sp.]
MHRSSGHPPLDQATLKAVAGWSFVPAIRNAQNIASLVQVPCGLHYPLIMQGSQIIDCQEELFAFSNENNYH